VAHGPRHTDRHHSGLHELRIPEWGGSGPLRQRLRALKGAMVYHPVELLLEWETRTNRPRDRGECENILEHWAPAPEGVALADTRSASPELMVILTTFARPGSATKVLQDLGRALDRAQLRERTSLLTLHDACDTEYTAARAAAVAAAPTSLWLDARQRFGKPQFWRMHQTALRVARAWRPRFALYLQDDVEFESDFLLRAFEQWHATADDRLRRVLYLYSSSDDEARGRWVNFARRERGACRLTNWFDLQAFLVDSAFFELLDHRMVPIHENRWKRRPQQSSGVGRQFTRRLFGRAHVYQAWPPLVVHGAALSTMNPEARALRPLDNRADYVPSSRRTAA
jgi:hypothetical protein